MCEDNLYDDDFYGRRDSYDDGYDDGYNDGQKTGYGQGHKVGYSTGYKTAKEIFNIKSTQLLILDEIDRKIHKLKTLIAKTPKS